MRAQALASQSSCESPGWASLQESQAESGASVARDEAAPSGASSSRAARCLAQSLIPLALGSACTLGCIACTALWSSAWSAWRPPNALRARTRKPRSQHRKNIMQMTCDCAVKVSMRISLSTVSQPYAETSHKCVREASFEACRAPELLAMPIEYMHACCKLQA